MCICVKLLTSFKPFPLSKDYFLFPSFQVDLYSGALFINQALRWNLYSSVFFLLALTAVCTMTGGLAAVIYTDTLQFIIMIFGGLFVMIKGNSNIETFLYCKVEKIT